MALSIAPNFPDAGNWQRTRRTAKGPRPSCRRLGYTSVPLAMVVAWLNWIMHTWPTRSGSSKTAS